MKSISQKHSLADFLAGEIARVGARCFFCVPGLQIEPLLLAVEQNPDLRVISASHECGAAYMADGYARMSGKYGACGAIGGPGTSNILSGVLTAQSHCVPVFCVTGNSSSQLHQMMAFQDWDTMKDYGNALNMEQPAESISIRSLEQIEPGLREVKNRLHQPISSFHLSVSCDLWDTLLPNTTMITCCGVDENPRDPNVSTTTDELLQYLVSKVRSGFGMIALVGPQLNNEEGCKSVLNFLNSYRIPCVSTLDAKGIIPQNHPSYFGEFGYGGTSEAFQLLSHNDTHVVLALGAELNERNCGGWSSHIFNGNREFHQVAKANHKSRKALHISKTLNYCPTTFVRLLHEQAQVNALKFVTPELTEKPFAPPKTNSVPTKETGTRKEMHPGDMIKELRQILPLDSILFVDSGAHRYFCYKYWKSDFPGSFFTAANTAPTGWAICAAIGASFASQGQRIYVVTGDSCMLMHGNELATAARYRVPVTFIISDNGSNMNLLQRMKANRSRGIHVALNHSVDWVAFSQSMGIKSFKVISITELRSVMKIVENETGPLTIVVKTRAEVGSEFVPWGLEGGFET